MSASGGARAIIAALFLERFVPAGVPWAHVDLFAWRPAAKPGETLFWQPAAAGEYTLRAVDDRGRADSRRLRVDVVQ